MSNNLVVRKSGEGENECIFLLPSTLALGVYHDILMAEKAWCIERMVANQKAEHETSDKIKRISDEQAQEAQSAPCLPCGEEVPV